MADPWENYGIICLNERDRGLMLEVGVITSLVAVKLIVCTELRRHDA